MIRFYSELFLVFLLSLSPYPSFPLSPHLPSFFSFLFLSITPSPYPPISPSLFYLPITLSPYLPIILFPLSLSPSLLILLSFFSPHHSLALSPYLPIILFSPHPHITPSFSFVPRSDFGNYNSAFRHAPRHEPCKVHD